MIGALIAAVIGGSGATCFEPLSFDFKEVPKAVRYGYYITDVAGKDFTGGTRVAKLWGEGVEVKAEGGRAQFTLRPWQSVMIEAEFDEKEAKR